MTAQECYLRFGGDYDGTIQRLGKPALLNRLLLRFRDMTDFSSLRLALSENKVEEAFRHAHTLKGVALNMGFSDLARSSSELTELLRAGKLEGSDVLFAAVERDFSAIIAAIEALDA